MNGIGYHGKVPSRGDFVGGNLPASFVRPWDHWLRAGVGCSRAQLGTGWTEPYLESPVWRFALAADLCGPAPVAGVLMPSVDAVERCFPFTLAVTLPRDTPPASVCRGCGAWFDRAEALARSALELDLSDFEAALAGLEPLAQPSVSEGPIFRFAEPAEDSGSGWLGLLAGRIPMAGTGYGLLWSEGSPHVAASLLVCFELPPAESFAALITGDWQGCGWRELAA